MKKLTFKVTIETDGDTEDLARCFEQYISTPGRNDLGFLSDYAADGVGAIATGYEGPFARSIAVERTT